MRCKNCGATLEDGDKFCISCGEKVTAEPKREPKRAVNKEPQKKRSSKKPRPVQEPVAYSEAATVAVERPAPVTTNSDLYQPVGVFKFLLVQILMFIPIVNIIAILAMSFSRKNNPSIRNYARAMLLLMIIGIGIAYATGYIDQIIYIIQSYMYQFR